MKHNWLNFIQNGRKYIFQHLEFVLRFQVLTNAADLRGLLSLKLDSDYKNESNTAF